MNKFQFGKIKTTKIDGNTATYIEENITNGIMNSPRRIRYEERVKVHSAREEQEEYLRFSDFIHTHSDLTLLNPEFRIECSRIGEKDGFYYIVKCWSHLEYDS